MTPRVLATALAGLALATLVLSRPAAAEPMRTLRGTAPRALAQMADVGAADADTPLEMTVILGVRDQRTLTAIVAAQQDARSPRFRRWLDGTELADRFGLRRADYERVRHWFAARGFEIVRDSPLRVSFVAQGTTAQAEAALATPIRLFRDRGRTYRGPAADAVLPESIAASVRGILGLDDLPKFRPVARLAGGQLALTPADFRAAYRVTPLGAAGLTGAGRTIAVVARSNFNDSDVLSFAARFLQPPVLRFTRKFVDPARDPGILTASGEEVEVLIDTQWAGALAPGAQVNVVISPRGGDIPDSLHKAVADHEGDTISVSFSLCEAEAPVVATEYFDALYARANAQGQTVLVASGDAGATECVTRTGRRTVNGLASSPHAVAVGGTGFDLRPDGSVPTSIDEQTWNDDYGAGGGGESARFARPPYQLAAGLLTPGRVLPDLALAASPAHPGYVIVEGGLNRIVGGTSASAPALASVLALMNERMAVTSGTGGLGQFLPSLYRLGSEQARGLRAPLFRDVTQGHNGFDGDPGYAAEPGFDLATGWGAPLFDALAAAIEAPGRCQPPDRCLVPGTGSRRRACAVEWLVEHDALVLHAGLPAPRQTCRDGDPGCDVDGAANGRCVINVALCVNVLDTRAPMLDREGFPTCPPRTVRAVRLLSPLANRRDPFAVANRVNLLGTLAGLPDLPTSLRTACTATVPVIVPLADDETPATRLRARVHTAGRATGATLHLRCAS